MRFYNLVLFCFCFCFCLSQKLVQIVLEKLYYFNHFVLKNCLILKKTFQIISSYYQLRSSEFPFFLIFIIKFSLLEISVGRLRVWMCVSILKLVLRSEKETWSLSTNFDFKAEVSTLILKKKRLFSGIRILLLSL